MNLAAGAWRSPGHGPEARSEGSEGSEGSAEPLAGLEPGLGAAEAAQDGTGGGEGTEQAPFINTVTLPIYEAAHHSLIE